MQGWYIQVELYVNGFMNMSFSKIKLLLFVLLYTAFYRIWQTGNGRKQHKAISGKTIDLIYIVCLFDWLRLNLFVLLHILELGRLVSQITINML